MNTTMPSIWKKHESHASKIFAITKALTLFISSTAQQRGKLVKGSMFDMKAQATSDRNKLYELMVTLRVLFNRNNRHNLKG